MPRVASQKGLRLVARNIMRLEPVADRLEAQAVQCARRQGGKLGGIEPRHRAGQLAEIERSHEFVEAADRMQRHGGAGQDRRRGDGERFDARIAQTRRSTSAPDRFESASPLAEAKRL